MSGVGHVASQRHGWRRGAPGESTRLMRAALGFFQASGERIPFALNYGSPPPPIGWSANEVCELGGVILHRNEWGYCASLIISRS